MRAFAYGVVAFAIFAAACNRPEAALTPASAPAAGAASEAAPIATTGNTESSSSADPVKDSRPSDWREVTIPAGTRLPIVLETAIGSDISRVEEPVQAHLARAVTVQGQPVLPAGSQVSGVITDAMRSGKVKGRAHVAVRFDSLTPKGPNVANERYTIQTATVGRTAPATKRKDAVKIGAPAAGGALVGALIGGKKGAAVGTAVGAGVGTAVVLETRGKEIRLGRGAAMTLQLAEPVTIRVRAQR